MNKDKYVPVHEIDHPFDHASHKPRIFFICILHHLFILLIPFPRAFRGVTQHVRGDFADGCPSSPQHRRSVVLCASTASGGRTG